MRAIGLPYSEVEQQGIYLPVIEASAKYHKPAYYDDPLAVESAVAEIPNARIQIHYKIFRNGELELLVEGFTVHIFLNAKTQRPTRAPESVKEAIKKAFIPEETL